jgi:hypothetical protein
MLIGAHAVLYSADAAADRAFLRDVLRLSMHWGRLTHIRLPGGGRIGVCESRHQRPLGVKLQEIVSLEAEFGDWWHGV